MALWVAKKDTTVPLDKGEKADWFHISGTAKNLSRGDTIDTDDLKDEFVASADPNVIGPA